MQVSQKKKERNNMKKLFALMLAVLMVFSMVACGSAQDSVDPDVAPVIPIFG